MITVQAESFLVKNAYVDYHVRSASHVHSEALSLAALADRTKFTLCKV